MKIEKDNACDRVDTCEEACKAANIRAQKAEDEVRIILKIVCDTDDMGSTIMMKMIPTRKANIRAQKAEDEVWIILKIVCDVDDMGSTIMMKKIPTRKSTSEQKAGHCEDCNW